MVSRLIARSTRTALPFRERAPYTPLRLDSRLTRPGRPSCVTSAPLSELARPLITSVVLSYDFVSRLSLGSIRDLKKVSEWLMYAVEDPDQKCNNIVRKALRIRAGGVGMSQRQKEMEADWVREGPCSTRGRAAEMTALQISSSRSARRWRPTWTACIW